MSYYKQQLKDWLSDKEVRSDMVLSVGNLNDDSKYFKSFEADLVETLDVEETFAPNKVADMNQDWLSEDLDWYSRRNAAFDDIFTFELWEYIWNPVQALKTCAWLLKPNGRLWVSAPFIYPTHNPTDQDYLRYTEYFWRNIPKKLGWFEVEEYQRRNWADSHGFLTSVGKDGMRPAKEYDHSLTGHLVILRRNDQQMRY